MKTLQNVLFASLILATAPIAVSAADAPSKATAAATDVSGTWDAVVETQQGSGTPVFTLKQDGEKISGTYKGQFGESALTGTVKGGKVSFTFTANAGEQLKMEYTGTVAGDSMKGTAKFGDYGEGTFTAKKRAK
jgi:hypothetical protein